jgi:alcohol dehydrogenase YqhD (iron-dependent ADH family)
VHQLEHAVSGIFDSVAHGAGLAVLFPAWARYVVAENFPRFASFARGVFDVAEADDEKAARLGIEKMAEFFAEIGMPGRLREFGLPAGCEEQLAEHCSKGGTRTVKSYIPMDKRVMKEIFESCY